MLESISRRACPVGRCKSIFGPKWCPGRHRLVSLRLGLGFSWNVHGHVRSQLRVHTLNSQVSNSLAKYRSKSARNASMPTTSVSAVPKSPRYSCTQFSSAALWKSTRRVPKAWCACRYISVMQLFTVAHPYRDRIYCVCHSVINQSCILFITTTAHRQITYPLDKTLFIFVVA